MKEDPKENDAEQTTATVEAEDEPDFEAMFYGWLDAQAEMPEEEQDEDLALFEPFRDGKAVSRGIQSWEGLCEAVGIWTKPVKGLTTEENLQVAEDVKTFMAMSARYGKDLSIPSHKNRTEEKVRQALVKALKAQKKS